MRTFVRLTAEQINELQAIFAALKKSSERGIKCAIGAQVFTDGLSIKVFHGEEARTLSIALGGDFSETVYTAKDSLSKGIDRDASRAELK